jgi:DNA (cytosine-5)-methyltransferase 1
MKHASLFSGIGGFELAAEWMGWENIFHCEINTFGKKILKHYWPKSISYDDIKKTDFTIHRGTIDVLTGGFPCQPYSQAGKRLGKEDERHLWPEMLRAIREIQPSYVVGENVRGLTNWNGGVVFDEVQADLEAEGYEVLPFLLPACAVNAPHRRDRIWFVAHRKSNGSTKFDMGKEESKFKVQSGNDINGCNGIKNATDTNGDGCKRLNGKNEKHTNKGGEYALNDIEPNDVTNESGKGLEWKIGRGTKEQGLTSDSTITPNTDSGKRCKGGLHEKGRIQAERYIGSRSTWQNGGNWENFPTQPPTQPPIRSRNDGISTELDGITFPKWRNESIKGYGNAIVPQVVYEIFKVIETMST